MPTSDKFLLYVYEGDFGLPSFDLECTQAILYCTIAKVPTQLKLLNSVKNCALYNAPCFVHKNVSFKSFSDIVLYLRTLNYNLDKDLSAKQKSESLAISNMVQSKLKVVHEVALWIDQRNCDEFTKVWHARALPLPFNHFRNKQLREKAMDLVESMYPSDYTVESIKDHLTTVATECLSSLSVRLGTSNFFFGNSPTTLDVIVYSYIAPLIKLPLPSNNISSLISMWPNLVNFVKRIDAKYLPDLPHESKYIRKEEKTKTSDEEVSYVAISILTFSAMSLVVGFAMSRGLISSKLF